jgi:hypothetical protein
MGARAASRVSNDNKAPRGALGREPLLKIRRAVHTQPDGTGHD